MKKPATAAPELSIVEGGAAELQTKSRGVRSKYQESGDVLYWKTRALSAESLGVKDNVKSCLTALQGIASMARTVDLTHVESEGQDYFDIKEVTSLLARIRQRAQITVEAVEGTRKRSE